MESFAAALPEDVSQGFQKLKDFSTVASQRAANSFIEPIWDLGC